MPTLEVKGKELTLDEDGFLQDWEEWDEEVAEALAKDTRFGEAIEMGDEHWDMVNYLRDYFIKYGVAPPIRMLTKYAKKQWGRDKGKLEYVYELFPQGPAKDACRIAGLPKPTGCV